VEFEGAGGDFFHFDDVFEKVEVAKSGYAVEEILLENRFVIFVASPSLVSYYCRVEKVRLTIYQSKDLRKGYLRLLRVLVQKFEYCPHFFAYLHVRLRKSKVEQPITAKSR
jgi:hypothetical protein